MLQKNNWKDNSLYVYCYLNVFRKIHANLNIAPANMKALN
jgi:hypothetical protein